KGIGRPQLRSVRALALAMSEAQTLVLERSPADFDEISEIITRALALALVPALLLALTGGWLLSRSAVKRIAAVHRASRLMMEAKGVGEDIAHDLRTPLTRLRTRVERVLETLPSAGDASASLSLAIED